MHPKSKNIIQTRTIKYYNTYFQTVKFSLSINYQKYSTKDHACYTR